jgi:hypothetical protein
MVKKDNKKVNEDSVAAETVHPDTRPANLPRTKFDTIKAVIGKFAEMTDEDLNNFEKIFTSVQFKGDLPSRVSSEHNKATIEAHPSHAVGKAVKEDIEALLAGGEGLSEEFKTQAAVLFETALNAQLQLKELELQEQFDKELDEKVREILENTSDSVDTFLNYTAQNWLKENKVAVEHALKIAVYEDFIAGMKKVFEETHINIPENKVDVVETLASEVSELQDALSEAIKENADLRQQVNEAARTKVVAKLSEGLTTLDIEKFKKFSESVEAEDIEEFSSKLKVIRESNFLKDLKKPSLLAEQMEEVDETKQNNEEPKEVSPAMKSYVDTIRRTNRF